MKKMRTLETMMEERSWASRKRWKARVGYGEGFLETRSFGSSIRGNIVRLTSDCAVSADSRLLFKAGRANSMGIYI